MITSIFQLFMMNGRYLRPAMIRATQTSPNIPDAFDSEHQKPGHVN
jgi:hypothetical protein